MLATKGTTIPTGAEWVHEVKWDGMRILAHTDRERVRLTSRTERDVTVAFPELRALTGGHLVLDGELVALVDGRPDFGALADRIHVTKLSRAERLAEQNPVLFLIFDVLAIAGQDVTHQPLSERRAQLRGLDLAGDHWQVPDEYDDGESLFAATKEQGLEGIVSKRLSGRYHPGVRSRDWLKFPHRTRGSYLVGGWRVETDSSSDRLGAVLVGEPTEAGLVYRGRVGSGLAGAKGRIVRDLLAEHTRAESPFDTEVPALDARGTRWVDPVVVVEVESLGLSAQQRLRQPSFQGVRADLDAAELAAAGSGE